MPYWLIALIAIWIGGLFFLFVRVLSYESQFLNNLPPGRSALDREGGFFDSGRYGPNSEEFYRRRMRLWWITMAFAVGGIVSIVMLGSFVARMSSTG
jgi:hypothetical protein